MLHVGMELTMQVTSGLVVFTHVCEQTLDTSRNCYDYNNNIHSAI